MNPNNINVTFDIIKPKGIFKPLSDFQQLIFREHENRILLRIVAKKNFEIGQLKSEIDRLTFEIPSNSKLHKLKETLTREIKLKVKHKILYETLHTEHLKLQKEYHKLKDHSNE